MYLALVNLLAKIVEIFQDLTFLLIAMALETRVTTFTQTQTSLDLSTRLDLATENHLPSIKYRQFIIIASNLWFRNEVNSKSFATLIY